jgi:hypothetical protein
MLDENWMITGIGKEGLKHLEKNLPQCSSVRHKSHMDEPGIEPGHLQ